MLKHYKINNDNYCFGVTREMVERRTSVQNEYGEQKTKNRAEDGRRDVYEMDRWFCFWDFIYRFVFKTKKRYFQKKKK